METRYYTINGLQTRDSESGNDLYLEGYFVRFDETYTVWEGATESIAPGAFDESIQGDVRALYNHNTDIVLGRTSAGTLTLTQDEQGLWGRIKVNRNDTDAMNAYERIKRGDITGCSFGFNIESEEEQRNADGTIHWTIKKVNPLFEISPCAFPAYEATHVSARKRDLEEIEARKKEAWREEMRKRLKGDNHGTESTDASEED